MDIKDVQRINEETLELILKDLSEGKIQDFKITPEYSGSNGGSTITLEGKVLWPALSEDVRQKMIKYMNSHNMSIGDEGMTITILVMKYSERMTMPEFMEMFYKKTEEMKQYIIKRAQMAIKEIEEEKQNG